MSRGHATEPGGKGHHNRRLHPVKHYVQGENMELEQRPPSASIKGYVNTYQGACKVQAGNIFVNTNPMRQHAQTPELTLCWSEPIAMPFRALLPCRAAGTKETALMQLQLSRVPVAQLAIAALRYKPVTIHQWLRHAQIPELTCTAVLFRTKLLLYLHTQRGKR